MTAVSPTPLTDDERARLRYADGSPVMLRGQSVESIVGSILLARETALRETIAQEIREREAKAWNAGFKNRHSEGRIDPDDPSYIAYGPNPYRGQA